MSEPKYQMGQKVKVVRHLTHPRYVGLVGVIVWVGKNWQPRPIYQIRTETKPPYYRPAHPEHGYIFTVMENEIKPSV